MSNLRDLHPCKLTLRPLSPELGAEVVDADLSRPVDDRAFEQIREALERHHGVLLFRDVNLMPEQHCALARRFGPIERHAADAFAHPVHPDILIVSNIMQQGKPIGAIFAGQYWHSDMSYVKKPPRQSLLYGLEIPAVGGDTMFANMYRAYDTLSAAMQRFLGGLKAVHDYTHAYDTYFNKLKERPPLTAEIKAKVPPVEHPIVRTHPGTGRKCLFVNAGFTTGIVGMPDDESKPLLEFLFRHCTRPEFIYRHQWRSRDLVIWDNSCTLHFAVADYDLAVPRLLHRVTVAGDVPH